MKRESTGPWKELEKNNFGDEDKQKEHSTKRCLGKCAQKTEWIQRMKSKHSPVRAHTQTKINEKYLRESGAEHKPRRSSIDVTGALEEHQRRQAEERENV